MDQILKIKLGREVKDYLSITFGLICYALGWPQKLGKRLWTSFTNSLLATLQN